MTIDAALVTTIVISVVGAFTAIGAITATWYHVRRISIEKARSETMKAYYEKLLTIEREKLEVEKAKLEARRGNEP